MLKRLPFVLAFLVVSSILLGDTNQYDLKTLLKIPERVDVAGREVALKTHMYLNLMPMVRSKDEPKGTPLVLRVWLTIKPEETTPSANLRIEHVWVINGTEIWEQRPTNEKDPFFKDAVIARGLVNWKSLDKVDVVVKFVNNATGEQYMIRAAKQFVRSAM